MRSIADVRAEAARVFGRYGGMWAWAEATGAEPPRLPLSVSLATPTEPSSDDAVRAILTWAEAWRAYSGPGSVEFVSRRWKFLGAQSLPSRIILASASEVASLAGSSGTWRTLSGRLAALVERWPGLSLPAPAIQRRIAALSDADWGAVVGFLEWAEGKDLSALLPRQIPVPGVDGKWFERNRVVVDALRAAGAGASSSTDVRRIESQILIRVLDPDLRAHIGGLSEFQASASELARLAWSPTDVIICENAQCAYSFGDRAGTVVLARQGYAVDVYGSLPWLTASRVRYWGDIDTHGFAILNRLRHHAPGATSVLMDSATLLAHQPLWATEAASHKGSLPLLTAAENSTYSTLVSGTHGAGVRLEQERIPWTEVLAAFARP